MLLLKSDFPTKLMIITGNVSYFAEKSKPHYSHKYMATVSMLITKRRV